jgi:hypothetical protein
VSGVLIVAVAGPLLLLGVVVAELTAAVVKGDGAGGTRSAALGELVYEWSRDHPFLAALLSAFVGAFAAHIFWHS